MPAEAALEEVLNTRLADLLKGAGLDAVPESKLGGGRRVDIMVAVDGHKVALEAKIGHPSLRGKAAKDDAAGRVEEGAAEVALAVCYPESLSRDGDLDASTRLDQHCQGLKSPRYDARLRSNGRSPASNTAGSSIPNTGRRQCPTSAKTARSPFVNNRRRQTPATTGTKKGEHNGCC